MWFFQSSSTYESIYEPINPRPPSQMSQRSGYSAYAAYGGRAPSGGPSRSASQMGPISANAKEREVDSLTDLLVGAMNDGHDDGETGEEDVYGACVKCGEKVSPKVCTVAFLIQRCVIFLRLLERTVAVLLWISCITLNASLVIIAL